MLSVYEGMQLQMMNRRLCHIMLQEFLDYAGCLELGAQLPISRWHVYDSC